MLEIPNVWISSIVQWLQPFPIEQSMQDTALMHSNAAPTCFRVFLNQNHSNSHLPAKINTLSIKCVSVFGVMRLPDLIKQHFGLLELYNWFATKSNIRVTVNFGVFVS